ncbi:MAG: hypothetical protein PHU25_01885 [Deltaproteobacteria bacterium]|nr:hypothetical protein [Deltaproteobacteria bacterium]
MRATLCMLLAVAALAMPATTRAQMDPAGSGEGPQPAIAQPAQGGDAGTGDDDFLAGKEAKPEIAAPVVEQDAGRAENPDTPYFGVGPRLRWIMIPNWFITMFGVDTQSRNKSALPLISNVAVGAEFTYRKGGFDITAAAWWASLGWSDPISYKESGKDGNSWSVITNDLQAFFLTVDFIWSTSFTDWVAITYGAGLGLGIPWGDIVETEATKKSGGFDKCKTADIGVDDWCNKGEDYGTVDDLPTGIVPWVNFLVGARFKPHRNVAVYVDGGFGLGFQLGTRAEYIF